MVGQEKALENGDERGRGLRAGLHLSARGLEAARRACRLTVVGEVVEEGIWMERGGQRRRVGARGYEHRIGRMD